MKRNRFRVVITVVVLGTFLVVQWNCTNQANNRQQRQLTMTTATKASLHGSASDPSLSSWPASKNVSASFAQDNRQNNHMDGIRKVPSHHPSLPAAPVTTSNSHMRATPSVDEDEEDRPTIMYSHAKSDRTGAALEDMLAAHAFCHARNWTYGGACEGRKASLDFPHDAMENQEAQRNMIQALGLDKVLPFACPETVNGNYFSNTHDILMARAGTYRNRGTQVFTSAWLKYIRSIVMQNGRLEEHRRRRVAERGQVIHVAVHVRRGDINPCYPYFKARYLTNSYYMEVLNRLPEMIHNNKKLRNHSPSMKEVSIYSERENFEGWNEFIDRNYSMHLDTNLIDDVFYDLLTTDVLVMSWSSLSLVAAVLNPYAELVVSPAKTWHRPMSKWVLATEAYDGMKPLQFTCPDKESGNSSILQS